MGKNIENVEVGRTALASNPLLDRQRMFLMEKSQVENSC